MVFFFFDLCGLQRDSTPLFFWELSAHDTAMRYMISRLFMGFGEKQH